MDKCPLCGYKIFFTRDPDDEYEINKFELTDQGCVFEDDLDPSAQLYPGREVFCDRCSWHGDIDQLQK